jgi:hypothetical protein
MAANKVSIILYVVFEGLERWLMDMWGYMKRAQFHGFAGRLRESSRPRSVPRKISASTYVIGYVIIHSLRRTFNFIDRTSEVGPHVALRMLRTLSPPTIILVFRDSSTEPARCASVPWHWTRVRTPNPVTSASRKYY